MPETPVSYKTKTLERRNDKKRKNKIKENEKGCRGIITHSRYSSQHETIDKQNETLERHVFNGKRVAHDQ